MRVYFLFAYIFLLSSCTSPQARWDARALPKVDENKVTALESRGDRLFAHRVDKAKLLQALDLWEKVAAEQPSGRIFAKLSRGHYFLADSIYGVRRDSEKRDKHLVLGLGFGEKSLHIFAPKVVEDIRKGAKFYQVAKNVPKEGLAGLYWYATNLSAWATSQGFITRLRYKDDSHAAMQRVKEIDQNYFYSGPNRYFGVWEVLTLGQAGGNLARAEELFAEAARWAPQYLGTKVLWAEFLCVKKKDKQQFEKLLKEVVATNIMQYPSLEAENHAEQEKARRLLSEINAYF